MHQFKSQHTASLATALLLLFSCRLAAYQEDFAAQFEKLAAASPSTISPMERAPTNGEVELLKRFATQPTATRMACLTKLLENDIDEVPIEYVTNVVTQGAPEVAQQVVDKILLPRVAKEELEEKLARILVQLDVDIQSERLTVIGFRWALRNCVTAKEIVSKLFWKEQASIFLAKLPNQQVTNLLPTIVEEWSRVRGQISENLATQAIDTPVLRSKATSQHSMATIVAECAFRLDAEELSPFRNKILDELCWSHAATQHLLPKLELSRTENARRIRQRQVNLRNWPRPAHFDDLSIQKSEIQFTDLADILEDESTTAKELDALVLNNRQTFENLNSEEARLLVQAVYQTYKREDFNDIYPRVNRYLARYQEQLKENEVWQLFSINMQIVSDADRPRRRNSSNGALVRQSVDLLPDDRLEEALSMLIEAQENESRPLAYDSLAEIICDRLPSKVAIEFVDQLKELNYQTAYLLILEKLSNEIREPIVSEMIQTIVSDSAKKTGRVIYELNNVAASIASSEKQTLECLEHCLSLIGEQLEIQDCEKLNSYTLARTSFHQISDQIVLEQLTPLILKLPGAKANTATKTLLKISSKFGEQLSVEQAKLVFETWQRLFEIENGRDNLFVSQFVSFILSRPEAESIDYFKRYLTSCMENASPNNSPRVPFAEFACIELFHPNMSSQMAVEAFRQLAPELARKKKLKRTTNRSLTRLLKNVDADDRQQIFDIAIEQIENTTSTLCLSTFTKCLSFTDLSDSDELKQRVLKIWLDKKSIARSTGSLLPLLQTGFRNKGTKDQVASTLLAGIGDGSLNPESWLPAFIAARSRLSKDESNLVAKLILSRPSIGLSSSVQGEASSEITASLFDQMKSNKQQAMRKLQFVARLLPPNEAEKWLNLLLDELRNDLKGGGEFRGIAASTITTLSEKSENGEDRLLEFAAEFVDLGDERVVSSLTFLAADALASLLVNDRAKFDRYHRLLFRRMPNLNHDLEAAIYEDLNKISSLDVWIDMAEQYLSSDKPSGAQENFKSNVLYMMTRRPVSQQLKIADHFARIDKHRKFVDEALIRGITTGGEFGTVVASTEKSKYLESPEMVGLPRIFAMRVLNQKWKR